MTAYLLLGPWTPLIFQGQESGSDTPFRFFANHNADLQARVVDGRREFLGQFTRFADEAVPSTAHPSIGEDVFDACRAGPDPPRAARCRQLFTDLVTMRHHDPTLGQHARRLSGATAGERTLLLRFEGATPSIDRLVVVNLDADVNLAALPDPIVAPPANHEWRVRWCSEDAKYGGSGIVASAPPERLLAGGRATTVFEPRALK